MQTEINFKRRHVKTVFAVSSGVLFLDQAIKLALTARIFDYPTFENHNALLGIPFDNGLALIFLAIILSYVIYRRKMLPASCDNGIIIYIGLILGGILGNATDRIARGFVVDYLTFAGYFSFNISDLAILLGSSLFFLKIIGK